MGLTLLESPTDDEQGQKRVQAVLRAELEAMGYEAVLVPADEFADHLMARRPGVPGDPPTQLLVGHSDTVWPIGTLAKMPAREVNGRIYGPGTFDMKSGLTQAIIALRALHALGETPQIEPVLFVNTEEEVGSPESRAPIAELAKSAERAIVLEPSFGPRGLVKTARKGVSRFHVSAHGRAAHSGLEPSKGASAILALAQAVVELHAMNDLARGTTVNVGIFEGGTRPNVIPAYAHVQVDVRATSVADADEIARAIHRLQPTVGGVTFEVEDCESAPPLERTARNRELWQTVRQVGGDLGLDLDHASAGGASDGNTTSIYTATIDGMGAVGDGAHAVHEHVEIDASLDRAALLALLLMTPTRGSEAGGATA